MFKLNSKKSLVFKIISLVVIETFIFTSSAGAYPDLGSLSKEKSDLRASAAKNNPLTLGGIEAELGLERFVNGGSVDFRFWEYVPETDKQEIRRKDIPSIISRRNKEGFFEGPIGGGLVARPSYPSDSLYLSQMPEGEIKGKTFIVRVDYNVPTDKEGNITDDSRIQASLATINFIRGRGGKVVLMSHLGRPKGVDESLRLDKVAERLEGLSGIPVTKFDEIVNAEIEEYVKKKMGTGEIVLLENVRFSPGDEAGDDAFAQRLAGLADIFVLDGFGVSHRGKQATVGGVAQYIPGVKGLLVEKEERGLASAFKTEGSLVVFLGGAKVSDKVKMIGGFLDRADRIFIGGGMANAFFKASGLEIGKSKVSEEDVEIAREIILKDKGKLALPLDVVVADRFSDDPKEMKEAKYKVVKVGGVPADWYIVDIGPMTVMNFKNLVADLNPRTAIWNGNMGVSELKPAAKGTQGITQLMADLTTKEGGESIICGGNTAEAVEKFGLKNKMTFVSTGGGAAIKFIENKGELSGFKNLAKAADYVPTREAQIWANAFPEVDFELNAYKINEFKDKNNQRAVIINYQMFLDNPSLGLAVNNVNKQLGEDKSLKFVLAYDRPGQEEAFYKKINQATNGAVNLDGQFDLVVSATENPDSVKKIVDKIKSEFENIETIELVGPEDWSQAYQDVPGIKDCIVVICEIGEGNNVAQGDLALWTGLNALVDEGILTHKEKRGLFALKDDQEGFFRIESKEVGKEVEDRVETYREIVASE